MLFLFRDILIKKYTVFFQRLARLIFKKKRLIGTAFLACKQYNCFHISFSTTSGGRFIQNLPIYVGEDNIQLSPLVVDLKFSENNFHAFLMFSFLL